ncbi:hypothetical protein CLU81_3585 [Flavobacterium sp. 9]|uniref:hypothetical protein n=1 Tax=Flavobacterium sp. 9 TaxID=2035198 RepID=UPI000C197F2D|nr:hypothetical protein [Flavobacterium sp. 9]PIF33015.1 hypothetical protein CLU81_3585 [Flavobacterium sp. 9]
MGNVFKPILYSTPMVSGILEDRKNQTRRTKGLEIINENPDLWKYEGLTIFISDTPINPTYQIFCSFLNLDSNIKKLVTSPFNVDDILWVRETFYSQDIESRKFVYKTDYTSETLKKLKKYQKWKPSIFMPKNACRIFLKVKSVKLERLQDISEEDSIAEGAIQHESETDWLTAKFGFQIIWETINGSDSWNKNPFVWVIEFERIEKPLDFI